MKTALFGDVAILLVDSHHGIYSGQILAKSIAREQWIDLTDVDHDILLAGPDHDDYLDVWSDISGKQFKGLDGVLYDIHELEDIWAVPADVEITNWEDFQ